MKKQYWVKLLILIFFLFLCLGCKTLLDENQITSASIDLAEAKLSQGQLKQAISVYTDTLEIIENEKLFYNKLLLLIEDKNYEEADKFAILAFQKYPYFLKFLKARIQINLDQNNYEEAIKIANQILDLSAFDDDAISIILKVLKDQNQNQELFLRAKEFYEKGYINDEILSILSQNDTSYLGIESYYLEKENSNSSTDKNPD